MISSTTSLTVLVISSINFATDIKFLVIMSCNISLSLSLTEDGESDEQVVLVSHSGTVNRIKVRDISIQSRFAR